MAEIFGGSWRVRVTGTSAEFAQRFRIAGADSGNGIYPGTVGTEITVNGDQWTIQLEWNNNKGSGWRESVVQRQSSQGPLVSAVVLKADDNFPDKRDNDFNDLVVVCEDLGSHKVSMEAVADAFRDAVCGPKHRDSPEVIWTDGGAQIVLHVGKLQVRAVDNAILVAVDSESAEFGVAPLMTRFVFGADDGPASLVAATDANVLGHPQVAARWGELFRDVIWAAFARLVEVQGDGSTPVAIKVGSDQLQIEFEKPVSLVALARAHLQDRVARGLRPAARARSET
jgi:hypothetical protein